MSECEQKKENIPPLVEDGQSYGLYMGWGEMDVAREFSQAARDTTAVFRGLLDGSGAVPH